jgi:aspartyl aminopeptidase
MERKCAWEKYPQDNQEELMKFSEEYRTFISAHKTERECVKGFVKMFREEGFMDIKEAFAQNRTLKAGDKVYCVNMEKAIVAYVIGTEPMEAGMNIVGAHIDSPRVDLKQNPLYEEGQLAQLKTHYYGGFKKYQWVTIPMSIHGVVVKKDGSVTEISIGDKADEPVFGISDLLVHLSEEQLEKKARKVIEGENMNIIVGNMPLADTEKDAVKANVLKLLKEKYAMEEEDFLSAELEVVPAGDARDFGLDRSMIMGYGHDDRVCAYPSARALIDMKEPKKTCVCLLVDKEEIGSVGATGMHSAFFEDMTAEIMNLCGEFSELKLRRTLRNSSVLSSDVSAGFDSNYASSFEKLNSAYLGKGMVINKYTGSRGKSSSNDANAEYMGKLRHILDGNDVSFQTAELGKVDLGGGGTIAYILANYGMQVIDCGVAVLNMHAPWEIISKVDLYETYRGYEAFLREA